MTDQSFPDHEYLTVRELADLLRLKERKVYDLASSGAVPCSRATGKLLFPAAEIRAWIERAQSGSAPLSAPRPSVLLGSHDPLLDWAIRQSQCGLPTFYDGSLDGLARFVNGEGVATGLHVRDSDNGLWNIPQVKEQALRQNAVLIAFARRNRGLVYRPDDPTPKNLRDIAGKRMAPRQTESGTDRLFRALATEASLDLDQIDFTDVARTEDEAVEAVRLGKADVTFGLAAVAQSYGLAFKPVLYEEFALLVDRRAWFEPPFQRLFQFFATPRFKERAAMTDGYDITDLGQILWNA